MKRVIYKECGIRMASDFNSNLESKKSRGQKASLQNSEDK